MSNAKDRAVDATVAMHAAIAAHGEGSAAATAAEDQAAAAVTDANRAGVTFDEIGKEVDRRL